MTTSGTYAFSPSLGEIGIYAFNIAQVRPTSLLQEHMQSLKMATNMMLATWANKGVNLWKVTKTQIPLVAGQSVYPLNPNMIVMLDAYMTIDNGNGQPIDRIILPISRSEYATYPNKEQQGFTTVYWMDRLISPSVTLWPVPDGTSAQYLTFYSVAQIQDAYVTGGQTPDIPYLWFEAFATGLAYRLAIIWNPQIATALKMLAEENYTIAATQNVEMADFWVSPQIGAYYR